MKSKTHYPVFILLALVLACGLFSCVDEDEGGYLQTKAIRMIPAIQITPTLRRIVT